MLMWNVSVKCATSCNAWFCIVCSIVMFVVEAISDHMVDTTLVLVFLQLSMLGVMSPCVYPIWSIWYGYSFWCFGHRDVNVFVVSLGSRVRPSIRNAFARSVVSNSSFVEFVNECSSVSDSWSCCCCGCYFIWTSV